ncbi:MAG: bifunctional UDP-N-acetylglucosamine diphosphorylase/glucosamine-1-phosphate N-acetyltransferase GlmU [Pseudomonadota bacterium]|nr:bifunctional UDP-N-acetylglucosamine diphosphorylase/glucosamine-1-phosphate N-acetyltransferase GlmU [Pseudomonadota bacterium]
MSAPLTAVVLAAGLGTRMRSPLAKVLHPLLGRPMVGWVVHALQALGADVIVVVNHQEEAVRKALPGVRFVRQPAPLGTGDALRAALPLLPESGPVLVTAGDTPLITAEALERLVHAHLAPATVASFIVHDPTGYGRIVRGSRNPRIVEQVECTPEEAEIREVNSGVYVFDAEYLRHALPSLESHAPKGEFYLTDLVREGATVVSGFDDSLFAGVNDRAALADARLVLRRRVNRAWALQGVDFADLDSAQVDVGVTLHPDASVGLGALLGGHSDVAGMVGPHAVVNDSTIMAGAILHASSIAVGAVMHPGSQAGPFARLRPGAVLEENAHVGNFVEVKNTVVRKGAKASHLAYLGDADVGEGANIGAGTITCNYDGFSKNRTVIGARSFIGSNTALVAPVTVGAGAIVGAGSTITADVPENAVALTRTPQKNLPNLAEKLRARYRARKASAAESKQ